MKRLLSLCSLLSLLNLFTGTRSEIISNPFAVSHDPDYSNGDIDWQEIESGVYHTTLVFTYRTLVRYEDNVPCSFRTRLFNASLPGPTLMMRPGNEYHVTLINELGPNNDENPANISNGFKDPNTTNIHTHGLHVSGEANADNTLIKIDPLSSFTYVYKIPCEHGGGLFWYHPHHHGSTAVQISGGAAGQIIIEESENELSALPDWYINMETRIMFIQAFEVFLTEGIYSIECNCENNIDALFEWYPSQCDTTLFYTVNGFYNGTMEINSGQWYKFRITHVDFIWPQSLYVVTRESYQVYKDDTSVAADYADCRLKLLSRDGIPVHGSDNRVPRDVEFMFFEVAQRADVAIMCINPQDVETYELVVMNDFADTIMHINVYGDGSSVDESDLEQLTSFEVTYRPSYIVNTLDIDSDDDGSGIEWNNFEITLSDMQVNGVKFNASSYLHSVEAYTYQDWYIYNIDSEFLPYTHPYHQHLFPFQVIEGGDDNRYYDIPTNWSVVGDFLDMLHGEGRIRFVTNTLGGNWILHCHILIHADEGSMALLYVNGGCDENFNDIDDTLTYPQCRYYEDISCATGNPTQSPTTYPTESPTFEPSVNPTKSPTFEPSVNPTKSPTLDPTVHPSKDPTKSPSNEPSNDPTKAPINIPTTSPTNEPSLHPSSDPTRMPSDYPTSSPSDNPTNEPTDKPSNMPTMIPTNVPTSNPVAAGISLMIEFDIEFYNVSDTNTSNMTTTADSSETSNVDAQITGSSNLSMRNVRLYIEAFLSNVFGVDTSEIEIEIGKEGIGNGVSFDVMIELYGIDENSTVGNELLSGNVTAYLKDLFSNSDNSFLQGLSDIFSFSYVQVVNFLSSLEVIANPTMEPTMEPTLAYTEGYCCHARDNTDRYEYYCNAVSNSTAGECLERKNALRCQWDFKCKANIESYLANVNDHDHDDDDTTGRLCSCSSTRSSWTAICAAYGDEQTTCVRMGCIYSCS